MKHIEAYMVNTNRYVFVVGFIVICILLMLCMLLISWLIHIPQLGRVLESITLWNIILSVILTPILETWLFQYLPIEFFKTYYNKTWQLTLISGIPFGLLHYFNQYLLRDAVYGVVIGVAFAYVYILAKKRKDINPVLATALVHAGYNLSGVVVRVVFA